MCGPDVRSECARGAACLQVGPARWFARQPGTEKIVSADEATWVYKGGYWKTREKRAGWEGSRDVFK